MIIRLVKMKNHSRKKFLNSKKSVIYKIVLKVGTISILKNMCVFVCVCTLNGVITHCI